jgi:hypothetical protein
MSNRISIPMWVVHLALVLALIDFTAGLVIGLKIGFAKGQQVAAQKP